MKIYEATVPSGPNQSLERVGVFTGHEKSIRQFVSLKSGSWRPDQVSLTSVELIHMDEQKLAAWQVIKQKSDAALKQLDAIEKQT